VDTHLIVSASGGVTARFVNSSTLLPIDTNQIAPPACASYSANPVSAALVCAQSLTLELQYNGACSITGMHREDMSPLRRIWIGRT
jgi:hypothetical protein